MCYQPVCNNPDATTLYDNEPGEEEDADPITQINGGQIKIHKQ